MPACCSLTSSHSSRMGRRTLPRWCNHNKSRNIQILIFFPSVFHCCVTWQIKELNFNLLKVRLDFTFLKIQPCGLRPLFYTLQHEILDSSCPKKGTILTALFLSQVCWGVTYICPLQCSSVIFETTYSPVTSAIIKIKIIKIQNSPSPKYCSSPSPTYNPL